MEIKTLYRYEREKDKISISPEKPDNDYTTLYRMVADEGMLLTQDGIKLCSVIDVESTEKWYEVPKSTETDELIEEENLD